MKLAQIVQKNFAFLGISSNQPRYNRQSTITFSMNGFGIIFSIIFLIFNANTFLEYTMNIFVTATLIAIWIDFMALLFKKEKLFNMIDELAEFVDESGYPKISILLLRKNPFFDNKMFKNAL